MKDIENKSGDVVREALGRLDRAVERLALAAADVPELRALRTAHAEVQAKLSESDQHKAILREAANRVATRLDTQIARLSAAGES